MSVLRPAYLDELLGGLRAHGHEFHHVLLDAPVRELVTPFAQGMDTLDEIPGVGPTAAHVMIAEIGVEMSRFRHPCPPGLPFRPRREGISRPQEGHRLHWVRQPLPGPGARRGHLAAGNTDTFLGERYRHLARRRGKKKPSSRSNAPSWVIVWHLLSDPGVRFHDLGSDFYDTRISLDRKKRTHIRQLEALGYTVTLQPAA